MAPEYVSELRVIARTVDGRQHTLQVATIDWAVEALDSARGETVWLSTVGGGVVSSAHIISLETDFRRCVLGS